MSKFLDEIHSTNSEGVITVLPNLYQHNIAGVTSAIDGYTCWVSFSIINTSPDEITRTKLAVALYELGMGTMNIPLSGAARKDGSSYPLVYMSWSGATSAAQIKPTIYADDGSTIGIYIQATSASWLSSITDKVVQLI